jgi:Bacterial antitoxin of type II TA system, VapB
MRTTLRLDDELLAEAKRYASQSGRTLTSLIEDALREVLARRQTKPSRPRVKLPTGGRGGVLPGVDLDNSAALLDVMESDE